VNNKIVALLPWRKWNCKGICKGEHR